jgi:DNA-binding MarR family transcriptional regulator
MPLEAADLIELQRATHVVLDALDAELRELGLSAGELNLLACLDPDGEQRIAELVAATAQRPSTVTGILDRLERRGLVERRLDPADRRSFRVALLPAGADAHGAVLRGYAAVAGRIEGAAGLRTALAAIGREPRAAAT